MWRLFIRLVAVVGLLALVYAGLQAVAWLGPTVYRVDQARLEATAPNTDAASGNATNEVDGNRRDESARP